MPCRTYSSIKMLFFSPTTSPSFLFWIIWLHYFIPINSSADFDIAISFGMVFSISIIFIFWATIVITAFLVPGSWFWICNITTNRNIAVQIIMAAKNIGKTSKTTQTLQSYPSEANHGNSGLANAKLASKWNTTYSNISAANLPKNTGKKKTNSYKRTSKQSIGIALRWPWQPWQSQRNGGPESLLQDSAPPEKRWNKLANKNWQLAPMQKRSQNHCTYPTMPTIAITGKMGPGDKKLLNNAIWTRHTPIHCGRHELWHPWLAITDQPTNHAINGRPTTNHTVLE